MRYLFLLLCCFSLNAQAQYFSEPTRLPVTPFPESWSGNWSGSLEIFNAKGMVQSVPMTIEIHKIDTSSENRYTFGLIYGSKEADWRPYELVPVAPDKGLWKVDEKNSIVMESYLFGPKLLCWFTVQGNRILCTYEKTNDTTLIFEVVAGMETAVSTTGNTQLESGEEISEVKTFPFSAFQRAVLTRQ